MVWQKAAAGHSFISLLLLLFIEWLFVVCSLHFFSFLFSINLLFFFRYFKHFWRRNLVQLHLIASAPTYELLLYGVWIHRTAFKPDDFSFRFFFSFILWFCCCLVYIRGLFKNYCSLLNAVHCLHKCNSYDIFVRLSRFFFFFFLLEFLCFIFASVSIL